MEEAQNPRNYEIISTREMNFLIELKSANYDRGAQNWTKRMPELPLSRLLPLRLHSDVESTKFSQFRIDFDAKNESSDS